MMSIRPFLALILILPFCCWNGKGAAAQTVDLENPISGVRTSPQPSLNNTGQYGLIRLPTARAAPPASFYTGITRDKTYMHYFFGYQPLPGLGATIRQSQDARNGETYPGVDFKFVLMREGEWMPQAAMGYTHAFGQPRFGGEYVVFNKRYWDFDFMGGLGWGRYAGDSSVRNPLTYLSRGYRNAGRDNGAGAAGPKSWFTGKHMGFFAGVDYQTPIDDLTLKFEYDPDKYAMEKYDNPNMKNGVPFNVGVVYQLWEKFFIGVGLEQGERAMLRINLMEQPKKWVTKREQLLAAGTYHPAQLVFDDEDEDEIQPLRDDVLIGQRDWEKTLRKRRQPYLTSREADTSLAVWLSEDGYSPTTRTLGRAGWVVDDYAAPRIQSLSLIPDNKGLQATRLRVYRSDFRAAKSLNTSPSEIWLTARLDQADKEEKPDRINLFGLDLPDGYWHRVRQMVDISPYEYGTGLMARARFLFETQYQPVNGVVLTAAPQIAGGLANDTIPPSPRPVRSDVERYNRVGIDQMHASFLTSLSSEWHTRLSLGQLEEMYHGASSEILWQPLRARWAVGAEFNHLVRTRPGMPFRPDGYQVNNGMVSLYYESLPYDLMAIVRAGRYLAKDWGGTVELVHQFDNGVKLGGYTTWTDQKDISGPEDFGHFDVGLRLTIPIGEFSPYLPDRSTQELRVASLGRDAGQRANTPLPLFDETRPVSYGRIIKNWDKILD